VKCEQIEKIRLCKRQISKQTNSLFFFIFNSLFVQLFNASQDEMLEHLNLGDVAETVGHFFELAKDRPGCRVQPAKKSILTIAEVDEHLSELTKLSKEAMKEDHLARIAKKYVPFVHGQECVMRTYCENSVILRH